MQAWLSEYHGSSHPGTFFTHTPERFSNTSPGLQAEPLELTSGVIWTALNIDYPGHSFSHLGIFFGERMHILIESTRILHDV